MSDEILELSVEIVRIIELNIDINSIDEPVEITTIQEFEVTL